MRGSSSGVWRAFAEAGGRIKGMSYESSESSFAEHIEGLFDKEAIYFVGFSSHVSLIAKRLLEAGYPGLRIANNPIATPWVRGAETADGIYTTIPIVYNPSYLFAQEFRRRYEMTFPEEFNHYAPTGYDMLKLIKKLEQCILTN